jgi:hypothetical protein
MLNQGPPSGADQQHPCGNQCSARGLRLERSSKGKRLGLEGPEHQAQWENEKEQESVEQFPKESVIAAWAHAIALVSQSWFHVTTS